MPNTKQIDLKTNLDVEIMCEEFAMNFFDGTGDRMAVTYQLRDIIYQRLLRIAKRGQDAGE